MRMTTAIVALLRELAKWLQLGARKPTPRANLIASESMSEPMPATRDDAHSKLEHPPERDIPAESLGERDGPSNEQPANGHPDDERPPVELSPNSVEPPSGTAAPEQEPSLPSCDADDQVQLRSEEAEPDESSTVAPPVEDEGEHTPPKTGEHPKNGNPNGGDRGNAGAGDSSKRRRKPRHISGRRGRQPGNPGSERKDSPSSRPELICRRVPASAIWEVILYADEQWPVAAVHLERTPLDSTGQQCRLPSLRGRLIVSSRDGQEHPVPLFEAEPLIFKLRKNWAGEGRRIARITTGYFIVIAPDTWQRTGRAPVEPDGCADPAFRAHYFHRDETASAGSVDGFREWSGSPDVTAIELTGRHIYDDSDDGLLFVGDAPTLESSPEIEWARIGEETEHGWGRNFRPDWQSLPEILAGREGRFFLRVYDREVSLLDSAAFRYVHDLIRIEVDGAEYAQDTLLVPTKTGYPRTEVRFIGAGGSTCTTVLGPQARQALTPSGAIVVPPHREADRVSCRLGSGAGAVDIVLDLPRIWWRLGHERLGTGEWRDTPLVMTREEFKNYAYADATLSLLSKREASVRAGFDDEPDQRYSRTIKDDRIAIPLSHFADHAQIDRRLNDDAHFNVRLAGGMVPLVVIAADPMPEIVSFTAEPATVLAGEETTLAWKTRNAGDARAVIDPGPGVVKSDGTHSVRPAETTRYTLTLLVSGAGDVTRTVTVAVDSPPQPERQPVARIMSSTGGWRSGKGFSASELRNAGLPVHEAATRSIPIDRRRRTSHRANVETIRSMLDG